MASFLFGKCQVWTQLFWGVEINAEWVCIEARTESLMKSFCSCLLYLCSNVSLMLMFGCSPSSSRTEDSGSNCGWGNAIFAGRRLADWSVGCPRPAQVFSIRQVSNTYDSWFSIYPIQIVTLPINKFSPYLSSVFLRCLLLVLESSRVEIAVLLNELAYFRHAVGTSKSEAFPLKNRNLAIAFSLVENVIKLISNHSEDEGNCFSCTRHHFNFISAVKKELFFFLQDFLSVCIWHLCTVWGFWHFKLEYKPVYINRSSNHVSIRSHQIAVP